MTARPNECIWFTGTPSWGLVSLFDIPVFASCQVTSMRRQMPRLISNLMNHPLYAARCFVTVGPRQTAAMLCWLPTAWALALDRVEIRPADRPERRRKSIRLPRRRRGGHRAPLRIALLVIAQNEEAVIGRALASAREHVDEMVVVDGGSTDDTVEIARAAGAAVIVREFDDDFAAQRNAGVETMSAEWVLALDADERLGDGLGSLVREVAASGLGDVASIVRFNHVSGEHEPAFWPSSKLALFERAGRRYRGRVHEEVAPWSRPLYFPLSGPYIQHETTRLRLFRSALHWSRINPEEHDSATIAWITSEIVRLETDASPDDLM